MHDKILSYRHVLSYSPSFYNRFHCKGGLKINKYGTHLREREREREREKERKREREGGRREMLEKRASEKMQS